MTTFPATVSPRRVVAALRAIENFIDSRWFVALVTALMVTAIYETSLTEMHHWWTDMRLAPTFNFVKGIDLYSGAASGPLLGTIYGPLAHLVYLPTIVFAEPTPAMFSALALANLMGYAPLVLIFFDRRTAGAAGGRWAFLAFAVVFFHIYRSTTINLDVHADPPMLMFSGFAAYFLMRHPLEKGSSGALIACGVCTALAVWTKQIAAPLIVAFPLYLALRGARRAALTSLAVGVGAAVALGAIFDAWLGDNMLWGMFNVTSRHPIFWTKITRTVDVLQGWEGVLTLATAVAFLTAAWQRLQPRTGAARPLAPDSHGWPLLFLAGAFCIPTAMLGHLKTSGATNNYCLTEYFFVAGLALALLRFAGTEELRAQPETMRALKLTLTLFLAVYGTEALFQAIRTHRDLWPPRNNASQQAFDYARAHPGTILYPWFPLASNMAEGKGYHSSYGLLDRIDAKLPFSDEHFWAYMPERLQYVAFTHFGDESDQELLARLPDFRCRTQLPELPGWIVFAKGPASCGSAPTQ